MTDSNQKSAKKPAKPYPDFPLFPHATGRWAKKIRGKLHYFGPWREPDAALQKYLEQRDDLHAGRTPMPTGEGMTLLDLCNHFLTWKKNMVKSGELTQRTFDDYEQTCALILQELGKNKIVSKLHPADFTKLRERLARKRGLVALGNQISRARVIFNYAYNADFIDRPLKYGPAFKRPSRRSMRVARAKKPKRLFEPEQIRKLLEEASPQMKAMILLGINCGLGNSDLAQMEKRHLTKQKTWLDYPRPKTGIERTCPLWPETTAAVKKHLKKRTDPKDKEHAELVFVTKYGGSWYKDTSDNPISNEFRKLADDTNIYRTGLTFYALRHTFETAAGESRDQVAVDHIMGHFRDDMASVYRESISTERLIEVSQHVHLWLFS